MNIHLNIHAHDFGDLLLLGLGRKYGIIYADPPWPFRTWSAKGRDRSPDKHYSEMTLQDLAALPVRDLADNPCVLALWVPWANLPDAIWLAGMWGFKYSTCGFVWHKLTAGGMSWMKKGYTTRQSTECCLFFKPHKGAMPKVRCHNLDQFVERLGAARHSEKPTVFMDRLEMLFGDVARVELFARKTRPGWDAMGRQLDLAK